MINKIKSYTDYFIDYFYYFVSNWSFSIFSILNTEYKMSLIKTHIADVFEEDAFSVNSFPELHHEYFSTES
ncbi:MAG: hypothetical protein ACK4ND_00040 [Cytophagaceae bacterium]